VSLFELALDARSRQPGSRPMLSAKQEGKLPDKMNIVIALRDQQFQLKRLLEMQLWVSATPKATLEEIEAQILATKATLAALEQLIIEQKARI
jgi:hypothetical protein